MILVTGAGGTVGTALVAELQKTGRSFRTAFHTPAKTAAALAAGHDAVTVDFAQPGSLGPALAGVETVFLLGTGVHGQTAGEIAVVESARAAGASRIVKLSVWGAAAENFKFAAIHRPVERAIEASGLAWTHLRPNGFMQNFINYMAGSIKTDGAFYQPAGDARVSHIDVRDIAKVAAVALTTTGHEGQAYELSGPRAISYAEAADTLSRVLGRPITYVAVSDDAARGGMLAAGIPEFYADYLIDLNASYRAGRFAGVSDAVEAVTGRAPIDFEAFAWEHAPAFR